MSVAAVQDLVSRVEVEARKVDPQRFALTVVALPFIAVGLVVGVLFKVVWAAVSWAYAAAKVGFELGRDMSAPRREGGG